MDEFVVISGYILEILILFIWYKTVVKKELCQNPDIRDEVEKNKENRDNFTKRTIKMIFVYRKLFFSMIFELFDCGDVKKENIKRIKGIIWNLICVSGWGMGSVLLAPLFVSSIANGSLASRIFCLVVIAGVLVKQLRERTQEYINALEDYIINVLYKFENGAQIYFPTENEIKKLKLDSHNKIMLSIFIGLAILLFFFMTWLQSIEWSKEARFIFGLVGFLIIAIYLLIETKKDRNKELKEENGDLEFSDYVYELIKDEIKEMCERLQISNIKFHVEYEGRDNAYAQNDENGIYKVVVDNGLLESFKKIAEEYGANLKDMFLVTIFHELGHVYYKDSESSYSKRTKNSCLIWLLIFIGSGFLTIWKIIPPMLYLLIIGSELLIGNVMCDKRYWKQIAELKADRLAVVNFERGRQAFVDFWGREEKIIREQEKTNELDESNFLYQFYKRYIEEEAHPSIKRRTFLISNRGRWKWWEYIEHALVIRKWRCKRRGWNGR